jgi:hypothetical protein
MGKTLTSGHEKTDDQHGKPYQANHRDLKKKKAYKWIFGRLDE